MMPMQNVSNKEILMCLIPILVGVIYDCIICIKIPFKGLAPIDEVKEVLIHVILSGTANNSLTACFILIKF